MMSTTTTTPDLPVLDSSRARLAEIAWVAREARELVGSADQERLRVYAARKAALLAALQEREAQGLA